MIQETGRMFRGFDQADRCWCYGFLYTDKDDKYWILTSKNTNKFIHADEVDAKSVSRNTFLQDKNNKEIYEGDILSMLNKKNNEPIKNNFKVYWSKTSAAFFLESIVKDGNESFKLPILCKPFYNMGEVIGSIYENPELLKP